MFIDCNAGDALCREFYTFKISAAPTYWQMIGKVGIHSVLEMFEYTFSGHENKHCWWGSSPNYSKPERKRSKHWKKRLGQLFLYRRPTENLCLLNGWLGTCIFDEAFKWRYFEEHAQQWEKGKWNRPVLKVFMWVWWDSNTSSKRAVHSGPDRFLEDGCGDHCLPSDRGQRSLSLLMRCSLMFVGIFTPRFKLKK